MILGGCQFQRHGERTSRNTDGVRLYKTRGWPGSWHAQQQSHKYACSHYVWFRSLCNFRESMSGLHKFAQTHLVISGCSFWWVVRTSPYESHWPNQRDAWSEMMHLKWEQINRDVCVMSESSYIMYVHITDSF